MARKDRTGNRKPRGQRSPEKIPELGYYLIVTDTEATERCYFQGLKKCLPRGIQHKLVIKVVETRTRELNMESWACCSEFQKIFQKKTGKKYSKSDTGLYEKICRTGNEEKALLIAKQKYEQCVREGKTIPSKMFPCTTVYQLVEEIRIKADSVAL